MKVTLLQTDIAWGDAEANIAAAEHLLNAQPASDLYVLPEMWSTGFVVKPESVEPLEQDCIALNWMRQVAHDRRCAVCGSLAVRLTDGTYRNRFYFIDGREQREYHYDKHHLFTHGGEHQHYTAGQQRVVVSYAGFRLLLLTCYDLRFPCWSRYSAEQPYDVIVLVANWPQSRQPAWQILTRSRAIENQAYFIGVNRVGEDPHSRYVGNSCIIDPIGRTLLQCPSAQAVALSAELSADELQRRRKKFRVLDDRD